MPYGSSRSVSFEDFFHGWCHRLAQLYAEISAAVSGKNGEERRQVINERDARALIGRVLAHFEEYYEHKSRAANRNGFALFSPTCFSTLECAFLWTAGFRPAILFQLVFNNNLDLSTDQTLALQRLQRETRIKEKIVDDEVAKIQESAAAPPLTYVLRNAALLTEDDSFNTTSEPVNRLRREIEAVMANADSLRVTTGAKIVEILTPYQCLRFLIVAIRLLQSLRSSGRGKDHLI